MQRLTNRGLLLLLTFCSIQMVKSTTDNERVRNKKHFSLFSVVTFKNEECSSESTFAGGVVKGTCYTSTECTDKGGVTSGNCASGFGVCCTFISKVGTATISENRTYLQSLLYPSIETSTTAITYTINKMQADICQLRLDFDNFVIAGPSATDESSQTLVATTLPLQTSCSDTWTTTLSSGAFIPIFCGCMTGEHIYMDMGMSTTGSATIVLTLATSTPSAATAMRSWRVKTSQIPCWAEYRAPPGCHRYMLDNFGQIISPNFRFGPSTTQAANGLNNGLELLGQDLTTCIRRSMGMCCVRYQVCGSYNGISLTQTANLSAVIALVSNEGLGGLISEGWSIEIDLDRTRAAGTLSTACNAVLDTQQCINASRNDAMCLGDYVEIPDSSTNVKSYGAAVQVNSRYCGNRFGYAAHSLFAEGTALTTTITAPSHQLVYDCSEPFQSHYHSDILNDDGQVIASLVANDVPSVTPRGFCLDYRQEAC